ncbi:titin isoform X1 [Nematostella vectensis]|uniref:titin isoform X1 n=1 Tax=Nematostella vectensis TaxID=45351 RepID=UPI002076E338|nr:titin isoform X1 [Nematostella vectensis]
MVSFAYGSEDYKRYSLPESTFKPINASAIFGGQLSFGVCPTEANIFRPAKPNANKIPKERKRVDRSNSDVATRRGSVDKRKAKDKEVIPRRRTPTKNHSAENGAVSPRSSTSEKGNENTEEDIDLNDSLEFTGDRYPLFIPVNDKANTENRPRKSSKSPSPPTNRTTQGESPKTSSSGHGQHSSRTAVRRSASFSSSQRRTSESESRSKPAVGKPRPVGNASVVRSPADSFRREKSDVVTVRGRGTQSPSSPRREISDLKSRSPSGVRREKSDIPFTRSKSPGGYKRENSDLVKPRATPSSVGLRREKSDLVSPRGACSRLPQIVKRENSDLTRPRTKAQVTQNIPTVSPSRVCKSPSDKSQGYHNHYHVSTTNAVISTNHSQEDFNSEDMSKIPTPQSRIPSLNKHSTPEQTKTPPKSKIPSLGKADKKVSKLKEPEVKKSGIPAPGSISKIPTTPSRPDSAKENKDPALINNDSIEETPKAAKPEAKTVSKIPSIGKSGSKSKIPSIGRQDSQGKGSDEEEPEHIVNGHGKTPVSKSKIASVGTSHQTTGIPTPGSKIPSVAKVIGPAKPAEKVDATPPSSKIPHLGSASSPITATPKTGIPMFSTSVQAENTESSIERKHSVPKSKIPSVSGASGIPKPGHKEESKLDTHESKLPVHSESKIPPPAVNGHSESKIPSVGGTPVSKIPSFSSKLQRKPSEEKHVENKPVENKPAETKQADNEPVFDKSKPNDEDKEIPPPPATAAKAPPPPPPRKDVEEPSPIEKHIFEEAKKMEKLLRNEDIVVEVPASNEPAAKTEDEIRKAEMCKFEQAQEAEDLISEVLKSYAPTLPTYSSDRSLDLLSNDRSPAMTPEKAKFTSKKSEDVKHTPPKEEKDVSFHTFGKRAPPAVTVKKEATPKEEIKEFNDSKTELKKDMALSLNVSKTMADESVAKRGELTPVKPPEIPPITSPETPVSTTPAIDTLGQYEQQARRSRSRQRKVITPDTEEPEKTFETETQREQEKQHVDKGKTPSESESKPTTKAAKVKSKHEKPKFVIESSLGKDFYSSKKPDDSSSKENIHDDIPKPEVIVIQNKTFDDTNITTKPAPVKEGKTKQESAAFEDVELSSHKGSKQEMRAWSMEQLDEKTVKCGCGRGGKCSIM